MNANERARARESARHAAAQARRHAESRTVSDDAVSAICELAQAVELLAAVSESQEGGR